MNVATKHRPRALSKVIGQQPAVESIQSLLHDGLPHTLLFHGPSGTGKTTLARIVARKLKCKEGDLTEINAANQNGVDMVRNLERTAGMAPLSGNVRVWIIDEAHQLTTQAQNAFLKLLEEPPQHAYFFLCTTDPQKLIRTVKTRCQTIELRALNQPALLELIGTTAKRLKTSFDDDTAERIAEAAEGSARAAVLTCQRLAHIDDRDAQRLAIDEGQNGKAFEIAQHLLRQTNYTNRKKAMKLVSECSDEPETVRRVVLAYMTKVVISCGRAADDAAEIIDLFQHPFYDSGKAGLALAVHSYYTQDN